MPSTLTVTSTADSGAGSLRAEIAAAHKGDTIVFAPSLDGQTITLTSGQLNISTNLTIEGPSDRSVTIGGGGKSRVFDVAKATVTATLSGLTISNGSAAGPTNTTIQGGGIYNDGTLTVSNCTLSNNKASNNGGGIANDGTLTVSSCTLTNNNGGYEGGGINNAGTLTVSNSTLSNNEATDGGGIRNGGTATVSGSILSGNSASGGEGGGIDDSVTITVSGSQLLGNSASLGGGICARGTVNISNCALTGNSATSWGGAIFFGGQSTLTLDGSTLSGNSATEGGALFVDGSGTAVTLTNDTMGSNTASSYGGGIYIVQVATVSIDPFTLANIINNTDSSGLNGPTANIDGAYTLLA